MDSDVFMYGTKPKKPAPAPQTVLATQTSAPRPMTKIAAP